MWGTVHSKVGERVEKAEQRGKTQETEGEEKVKVKTKNGK